MNDSYPTRLSNPIEVDKVAAEQPQRIGRYRIERILGEGRTVRRLGRPNIVPVYDVGSAEEFPCYVVSKFIEGSTLAQRIKANRPSVAETAELVATIAETLHYAHKQGIVHRDVKPGN